MVRLNSDIPETAHQILRIHAANKGMTLKDLMLSKIAAEIEQGAAAERHLRIDADNWEKARQNLQLKRGSKQFRDVIHESHKW